MKIYKKLLAILLFALILVLSSSCSKFTGVKIDKNQNISEESIEAEVESGVTLGTIRDTQILLDQIGPRLIGREGNYLFTEELKEYFKNFPEAEIISQPYRMNLYSEYKVSVATGTETITFDSNNSICKLINDGKFDESAIITDTLEGLDRLETYIFITENIDLIERSKEYDNVCLSLLAVDEIYLGQNAIKTRNNMPTIMNVDKVTAKKLLTYIGQNADLKIDAITNDFELNNIYALVKGKESSDAIVITSHIDTTTALGNNYSKGAIDNGSGIALNLDLFRKFYESKNESSYDVIFSFVNSEEGFLTRSNSGSMQLSASLSFKYKSLININLDCLGEKNINLLSYGYQGNIKGHKLREIINNLNLDSFDLEKVDYYTSDNLSFDNAIYFYNFDYHGENRAIHTERDTIDAVDLDSLENLSSIIFSVLSELLKVPREEILE